MQRSEVINGILQKSVIDGKKIPHSTSYPVIIKENGKYYLATFTFFYSREDIEAGMVERPTMWAIADIETGKIIEERLTKDKDFSDASYDIKYNVRADGVYDTSKKYYDEAFAILDSCRSNGVIDTINIFRNIENNNSYKYNREIIVNLFRSQYQTEIINKLFLQSLGIDKQTQQPEPLYTMSYAEELAFEDNSNTKVR